MTGNDLNYADILRRWKRTREQAANDLERYLLRGELPDPGSVARAVVTLRSNLESEEDIVERLIDTLKTRECAFDYDMAMGWCGQFQYDKNTTLTEDQAQTFAQAMLYANSVIYEDLIDMVDANGLDF